MNEQDIPTDDDYDDRQQMDSEEHYHNWMQDTVRGTQANARGISRPEPPPSEPEPDPDLYEVKEKDKYDDVHDALTYVQSRLRVPKDMTNSFGGYSYRNAESMYKEIKRNLPDGAACWIVDDLEHKGERYYIKSTVHFKYGGDVVTANGWAREQEVQKGKDESQITGSAQSYSRKYAMQAMFLIDDGKEEIDDRPSSNHFDKLPEKTTREKPKQSLQLMNVIIECCLVDDKNAQIKAYRSWKRASDEGKKATWPMLQPKVQVWLKDILRRIDEAKAKEAKK